MPWKMCERGNKIHSPNIPDVVYGHAEDCLCPVFLSREVKAPEYISIQKCHVITDFFSNNHRAFLR